MDSVARYAGSAQSVTPPSGAVWSNPGNATGSSDSNSASASIGKNDVSQTLVLTDYGFANDIPMDTNIFGIEVRVRRLASDSGVRDNEIQLRYQGSPIGTIKADTETHWGNTASTAVYGGLGDMWDASLTPEMVRDSSFGVGISAENGNQVGSRTAQVYWVEITVFYGDLSSPRQWFTDFSEYEPDQVPHDWSEYDSGGTGVVRDSGLPPGTTNGRAFAAADALRMVWDKTGLIIGDVEVVAKLRQTSLTSNSDSMRLTLHNDGGPEPSNYYFTSLATDPENNRRIYKFVGSTGSVVAAGSGSSASNVWYWLRFGRSGSQLRVKSWVDGDNEPPSWQVTGTDTSHNAGYAGLFRTSGGTLWVDCFGVGTGGRPAPTEPLQPDPPTGLTLNATGPNSISVTWNEPD